MLVVMENHATPEQIERVVKTIEEMGYSARPMPGETRTTVGLVGNDHARQNRYRGGGHDPFRLDLRSHRCDRLWCGADEDDPGLCARSSKLFVLREEAIAGVNRIGAGPLRSGEHQVCAEVGVGRRRAGEIDGLIRFADIR